MLILAYLEETTNGHVLIAKVGQIVIMESGCGPHIMPGEGLAPSGKLFLSNSIWTVFEQNLIPVRSWPGLTRTAPTDART